MKLIFLREILVLNIISYEYLYHHFIRTFLVKFPERVHLMIKSVEESPRLIRSQQKSLLVSDLVWDMLHNSMHLKRFY